MKTKLLFYLLSIFSLCICAQTATYNINWGFGSNPGNSDPDANANRTIEEGDTVTWTWIADGGSHNVVSEAGSTESFSSGSTTSAPQTFSYTFTVIGSNDYVCQPHSSMFGTITVVADGTLSTDEFRDIDFSLSPNPVKNILTVVLPNNLQNAQLEIFNVLGKRILRKEISTLNNTVNVSNLNNGIYIVRVSNGKLSQSKRLIKQ